MADPMNGYGLVASIVQSIASLAWPTAFVALGWIFRQRLASLLPLLHVKHKDWEIGFRLDQAERDAAALPPVPEHAEIEPTPEERSRFDQLAAISPDAAILSIRRELENTLLDVGKEFSIGNLSPDSRPLTLVAMTRLMRLRGVIDEHTSAILDDLRAVGNAAAHGGRGTQFTKEDALRYKDLADDITRRLEAQVAFKKAPPLPE